MIADLERCGWRPRGGVERSYRRGPDPPEVALRMAAAEADPSTFALEDPVGARVTVVNLLHMMLTGLHQCGRMNLYFGSYLLGNS
jgi:hypothetical protein